MNNGNDYFMHNITFCILPCFWFIMDCFTLYNHYPVLISPALPEDGWIYLCFDISLICSGLCMAVDWLLPKDKFQVANSRHACATGSVTTDLQPLTAPPSRPARATPLIVSDRGNWFQLTPIQRPFDWQTKDTATWRLMLGLSSLEVVQAPLTSSFLSHGSYHALA